MKTLNFLQGLPTSNTSYAILAIVITFLAFALLIILTLIYRMITINKTLMNHYKFFVSDRIFIINLKDQVVDYFDFVDLRKIQTMSYIDFLNFFPDADQNSVRQYITQLLDIQFNPNSEEAISIININVMVGKHKFTNRAMLKCRQVDKEKQTVYIEGTRLIHTPIEHKTNTKKNAKHDIYELGVIKKMYDEGRFNKGSMYVFRFYLKPNTVNYVNDFALRAYLVDAIYSITNNNISYFFYSDNAIEFSLLDTRQFNDYQMSRFTFDMVHQIDKYLEIHGLELNYGYNVCSAQVSDLPLYFDNAYDALDKLFKTAKAINRKVSTYKSDMNEDSIIESTYKVEISRIIKDKDFYVNFSPYVHITNSRVIIVGYLSAIIFHSNLIDDSHSVFERADEYDLTSDLYSLICRKIIPPFISQSQNVASQKLVIEVTYKDLPEILKVVSHISKASTIKLVFMLHSIEFIDIEDDPNIEGLFKSIRAKGYEVGMIIKQNDYVLKGATYGLFDCFFVDPEVENNVKIDSRSFIKAKSIVDNLAKFNKPIVAINVPNFQGIELLSKIGIKDFSSEAIGKKDKMILPVDSKVNKRLLAMIK